MKESCSLAERQLLRSGIRSRVLETRIGQNARATFSGCHSGLHSTSSGGSGAPPVVPARPNEPITRTKSIENLPDRPRSTRRYRHAHAQSLLAFISLVLLPRSIHDVPRIL